MTLEQFKKFCEDYPQLGLIVKTIVAPLALMVVLGGLIIGCFILEQMFDDKQTYNSGNTVVDFINWISNAGSSDAAADSAESNGVTSYETEADHTSVVESNQTGTVDRVGNDQTSVHK